MKYFIALLFTTSAFADCHLFYLKGAVRLVDSDLTLIVNEGTASERKFPALRSNERAIGSYLGHHVSGKFILGTRHPLSGSKLLGIDKVELSVPDPLHHEKEFKYKRKVPCPK